jgi:catechol 2,3-dioxygenase-like lactoylglutathione lyase family enzyme
MVDLHTPHADLHGEQGAVRGDRPARARNPLTKVRGLAWLEFAKPDLDAAERFAHDFGFTTAARTPDALHLRGVLAGSHCVVIRRAERSRFLGATFEAVDERDVRRLAAAHDASVRQLPGPGGGLAVTLTDPAGVPVQVVARVEELPALPRQRVQTYNLGGVVARVNRPQRPPREPARIERLGHVVLETTSFNRTLDWYLENLGLIVSDFLYYPGQRERGPTMAFIRCDQGGVPSDHHTLAMLLGPGRRYVHSAYQVADLDAVAAGGEYLKQRRYHHAWGVGRHIQGSQIFDYWRDPDGFMVEHYADGDLFDDTVEVGWAPMTASGLSQWGPPVTMDFLDAKPNPHLMKRLVAALADRDNEFDLRRLGAMLKVARA